MQAILDSVDEVDEEFKWTWVHSFNSYFLHEDVLAFKSDDISLVFWEESWDFTGSEHTVDGFKEALRFDFSVGHDEGDLIAFWSSLGVEILDILLEVVVVVRLGE
jgi:hypothetical protein